MKVTEFTITETVYNGPAYELPNDIQEFMQWMNEKFNSIPKEYQSEATIHFGYDDIKEYTTVDFYYRRPENNEERMKRIKDKTKSGEDYRLYLSLKERFKGVE